MQDQAAVLGLILVTMTTLVGCGSAHKRDGGVEGNGMPAGATPGMAAATAPPALRPGHNQEEHEYSLCPECDERAARRRLQSPDPPSGKLYPR